ncbi:OprD family outer membrane porin [Pseudomonas sp. NPDC007930]|uniref:OprD family outer membrane porin n=1 Tax=Pseudomonas sp. NPDC007930 TaxID=3364417 RepID=UPI0036E2CF4E
MKLQKTLPLLSLGFAPVAAHADFIDGSHAGLTLRNFYYNHDLRDTKAPAQSKIEEWAQGFIFKAQSGYTDTPIGVGVDVYAGMGLKLDSSPSRSGSELLPGFTHRLGSGRDSDPRSADQWSEGTAALKFKYSKTELKAGGLFPKNPLVYAGDSRLLPQTFEGMMLDSQEIEHFTFSLGQMRQTSYRAASHSGDMQVGNYLKVDSDRFNYLGGTWAPVPSFSLGLWGGTLEGVYTQKLLTTTKWIDLAGWRFSGTLNYTDSGQQGAAMAGKLDSRLASTLASATYGMQKFTLGYQYNAGTSAQPYLQETDLPAVGNAIQVLHFDRAQERSWQARYDLDFAGVGVPGLTAFARYVQGGNFQYAGQDGKEWERNIDVSYVIQSGPLRGASVRWRNVELQGNATGRRDENRLIVAYTLALK